MKILLTLLTCLLCASPLRAETSYRVPADEARPELLTVYGAADFPTIKPVLDAFTRRQPRIAVSYTEFNTQVLHTKLLRDAPFAPDLVMSSAIDLQFKLVNDGFAQPYYSEETALLPRWASWRDEIFGFTYEPAVLAINTRLLGAHPIPRTRAELLSLIRNDPERFRGRIGTFDIEQVGAGYLTWAHDRQQSGSYGRMLEVFGSHQTRRFPSSASMLEALSNDELVVAYNLLGSYAQAWAATHPEIHVVMPEDFTTLIMRTAFIPKYARHAHQAGLFLDFLLSEQGQRLLADQSHLYPVRESLEGYETGSSLRQLSDSRFRPIPLDLSLLVMMDKAKKQLILDEWETTMKELQ